MKKIIKGILFVFIFIILFLYLGENFFGRSNLYTWCFMDVLYDMPKDCTNVAVFGSSMVQHGFLHMDFYNKTKLNVLPLATSSERIEITYYKMLEMYKTQKPELILVDLYLASDVPSTEKEENEYLHIPLDILRLNFNKIRAINSVISIKNRPYYYFKLLYYKSNWKSKSYVKTKDNIIIRNSYNEMYINSFYIEDFNVQLIYETKDKVKNEVYNECLNPYLYKIINLAKENNSKVIFTVFPKVAKDFEIYRFEVLKKQFENDKDIYFINMCEKIDEIGLNQYNDFLDYDHVNINGAKKVTKYLTEYIKSLDISFHEKGYKYIWDEAYEQYLNME